VVYVEKHKRMASATSAPLRIEGTPCFILLSGTGGKAIPCS
jgi:hypothetical protein